MISDSAHHHNARVPSDLTLDTVKDKTELAYCHKGWTKYSKENGMTVQHTASQGVPKIFWCLTL